VTRRVLRRRAAAWGIAAALALFWLVVLRPQWLGGPAAYIIVQGDSMLPSLNSGDLVMLQRSTDYGAGDVVGYRVPQGDVGAGHIVLHRIVARSANGYVLKGDNNPVDDPWLAAEADLIGAASFAIPGVGGLIAGALRPVNAAALATALVVALAVDRSLSSSKVRAPSARPTRATRPCS
jgi:signal peptidase I